ncbi:beta family protein [Enterococcus malodoratus]|uniref:beta family protein n=1 Tax=Enterococcus malodoratus TaxID=71451 RepID=UPI00207476E4|nr:beta family protein [Enterococcus malodoratus]
MYVPVLKEKQGEKDSILQLKESTKNLIQPLFEISPEHFDNANCNFMDKCWKDRVFYLDFPYEKILEGIDDRHFDSWFLKGNFNYMIPVVHLSYEDKKIMKLRTLLKKEIAIRITLDEFY